MTKLLLIAQTIERIGLLFIFKFLLRARTYTHAHLCDTSAET